MSNAIKSGFLIFGCLLLGWAISSVDLASVVQLLKKMGWGFAVIVFIYAGVTWLDTLSWKNNFHPEETRLFSNWQLWRIRQVGEAYNTITPFATLGGEPMKAQLLKDHHGLSLKSALASQIVSKTTFLAGLILFFIPGIALILLSSKISAEFKLISLTGMVGFSTCIFLFFIVQVSGTMGKFCVWLSHKLSQRNLIHFLAKLGHLNELVSGFYKKYPARVIKASGLAFLGWILGLGELYTILYFLGFQVSFYELWVIEALGQLVKVGSFFIPLRLGAQEGGLILILTALGYPANLGLAVSLVARIKELAWVGLGLALGGKLTITHRPTPAGDD